MKMTPQEFEKAVEVCTGGSSTCHGCPLEFESDSCKLDLLRYVKEHFLNRGEVLASTEETAEMPEMIAFRKEDIEALYKCSKHIAGIVYDANKRMGTQRGNGKLFAYDMGRIEETNRYAIDKLESMIYSCEENEDTEG